MHNSASHLWPMIAAQIEAHTGVRMARLLRAGVRPDTNAPKSMDVLLSDPALRAERNKIFVPETYFFRHIEHWNWLYAAAVVAARKKKALRVLCLGSSTGEEVWSAAAVLQEARCPIVPQQVVGWELVQERIDRARTGNYELWSMRTEVERFGRWVTVDGATVSVNPALYERVNFVQQNIMDLPAISQKFDVVLCRNVAIYWSLEAKRSLVNWLASALQPNGTAIFSATDNFSGVSGVYYDHALRSTVYRQTAKPTCTDEPAVKKDDQSNSDSVKQLKAREVRADSADSVAAASDSLDKQLAAQDYEQALQLAASGDADGAKISIRRAIFRDGSSAEYWRMYRFLNDNSTDGEREQKR